MQKQTIEFAVRQKGGVVEQVGKSVIYSPKQEKNTVPNWKHGKVNKMERNMPTWNRY